MLPQVKVTNLDQKWSFLSEAGQDIDIRFALAAEGAGPGEIHQSTPFIKCRDYFSDELYFAEFPENRGSIYGYKANTDLTWHKALQADKPVYMLVIDGSKTNMDPIKHTFNVLPIKYLEKKWDVADSKLTSIVQYKSEMHKETRDMLIIRMSPVWFSSTVHLHLFSFILRIICDPKWQDKLPNKLLSLDAFIRNFTKMNPIVFGHIDDILHAYQRGPNAPYSVDSGLSIHNVHNGGGIISLYECVENYNATNNSPAGSLYRNWLIRKIGKVKKAKK